MTACSFCRKSPEYNDVRYIQSPDKKTMICETCFDQMAQILDDARAEGKKISRAKRAAARVILIRRDDPLRYGWSHA